MNTQSATTKDQTVIATVCMGKQSLTAMTTLVLWICLLTGAVGAQELPQAPTKATTPPQTYNGDYDWIYRAGVVCGAGASDPSAATKPTVQCGGILGLSFLDFEAGGMGPIANHSGISGYLGTNVWVPLMPWPWRDLGNKHGVPIALGGYTQMFGASNAVDYGLAYAYPVGESHFVQFEARDYWTYASPSQHNLIFRITWLKCIPDP